MSVLIKGMKMPAKGEYELRLFCHSDGTATLEGFSIEFEGEPFEAIEVPTPHGRLIDADERLEIIECLFKDLNSFENYMYNHGVGDSIATIKNAPTIIEAEEGEEA